METPSHYFRLIYGVRDVGEPESSTVRIGMSLTGFAERDEDYIPIPEDVFRAHPEYFFWTHAGVLDDQQNIVERLLSNAQQSLFNFRLDQRRTPVLGQSLDFWGRQEQITCVGLRKHPPQSAESTICRSRSAWKFRNLSIRSCDVV